MDHTGRDTKPHIVRHSSNSNHKTVNTENFKILNIDTIAILIKGEYRSHYLRSNIALPSICKTALFLCSFIIDLIVLL